jgi:hypothetical protein
MALFIRQNEDRSKLQERLAAELQEKAKARALENNTSDDIEDSQYLKDTKPTTSLAWVWVVILIIAVGIVLALMMQSPQ